MQRNAIEPILGALVLAAAVAFLVYAYHKAGQRDFKGYPLTARFSSISGLQTGSDVRIGGVKVGEVTSITIDPESYLAVVDLTIVPEIKVPEDSVASVATEGLLGGKFLGLEPGASDTMLKAGARIDRTEPSVSLESIIGQLMYGGSTSSGKSETKAPPVPSPSANSSPGSAPTSSAPAHP